MRTVVSEFDAPRGRELGSAASDLGYDSLPAELRGTRAPAAVAGAAWRPAVYRRPCPARVQSGARTRANVRSGHVVARRVAGRAAGPHPLHRVHRAQMGFAALALSALLTALAVTGLIALAQLRAGDFGTETTPPAVELVHAPAPAPAPAR
ncbi:hypothetical protein [Nocardia yamanashiensis]|uniref:hypothetical protein n=1 Tax=Nocardia yamanashiensis TaxID=209247 RepID=UPI00082A9D41|nr:hypothetical protein [Nocardia yamanashiensis]